MVPVGVGPPVSRACTPRDSLRRGCALEALEVAGALTVAVAIAFAFRVFTVASQSATPMVLAFAIAVGVDDRPGSCKCSHPSETQLKQSLASWQLHKANRETDRTRAEGEHAMVGDNTTNV